jgi:Fe-S-cluster containining protein
VQRLAVATGREQHELVEWLAPDVVDMSGEPQSFVDLSAGRRLMVLAQRGGACSLLGTDNRCSAYAARPRDCQAYPFDIARMSDASGKRHLALLPLDGCDYADDGAQDRDALEATDDARFRELERYQAQVARWNRLAWHRRRLGKPIGTATAFLEFMLTAEADGS